MKWFQIRKSLGCLLPLFITLMISSCSLVEYKTKVTYQGKDQPIPEEAIKTIRKGKTDKKWLINNIGYPDSIKRKGDREIYTYRFSENRGTYISVFLIYSNEYVQQVDTEFFFEIKNGAIERYWSEEAPQKVAEKAKNSGSVAMIYGAVVEDGAPVKQQTDDEGFDGQTIEDEIEAEELEDGE